MESAPEPAIEFAVICPTEAEPVASDFNVNLPVKVVYKTSPEPTFKVAAGAMSIFPAPVSVGLAEVPTWLTVKAFPTVTLPATFNEQPVPTITPPVPEAVSVPPDTTLSVPFTFNVVLLKVNNEDAPILDVPVLARVTVPPEIVAFGFDTTKADVRLSVLPDAKIGRAHV